MTSVIGNMYDQITLGGLNAHGHIHGATTEDILVVIARLISERVTPSGGARMLAGWHDNGELIGIEDQPVLYFRNDEPHVIYDHQYPSNEDAINAEFRIYHPDSIHIAPDGTTMADRDVAMAQLLAAMEAKPKS